MGDDWVFEKDEGLTAEAEHGVVVFCPICGCCSLKRGPRFTPSLMTQAEIISRGEKWTPKEEDLVWTCSGGCTKTKRHA
jgi:hypothetical protein